MRHLKILIAGGALAAVAAGGGVTLASAGSSAASPAPSAQPTATSPTVRTVPAPVGGKTETILVNANGLPLYFYRPDKATKSLVTGPLAQLWPPLTAATPTAAGLSGKLTAVNDAHGHQVAYNGHLLYTFASDQANQVTGQGVQDFFVATPGLPAITASSASAGTVPATPPSGGYGY
jgi:predicted lipoprotein with Yx(FWY)xxD motif